MPRQKAKPKFTTYVIDLHVVLQKITIEIPEHSPPEIHLEGRIKTPDARVGRVSQNVVSTQHLTDSGRKFIEDMVREFRDRNVSV